MEWLLTHPGLTAAIVAGVVLLLLIAVTPESLVNVVDQLFQLCGRLVGALAGEAAAGADALFAIVGGVFNMSQKSAKPAAQPAPQASAAAANGADQAQAAAQPVEDDTPFMWVAETIFVRLLYLATVIIVVGSDFVFAILRLQAVLFPSLPAPVSDLSFLSLLTGAFFVAIVLLTGALTLDFLNVLPPPARLFPNLDDGKRKLLLVICVVSFFLSLLVVGALFLQGQILISEAATFPLGAIILAALIGVLEVLVAFLGAWGAIRGLAIILALLGGVIGLVFHFLALGLRWIADGFDVIGNSILPDIIYGIAALFGHQRERPPRPSPAGNVLTIVGYGERSTLFTIALSSNVVRMFARSGLLAVGAYAEEPSVREDARSRLSNLGVNDISPINDHDAAPLGTLKTHILRAYRGKGVSNKVVLWVVDGDKVAQCAQTLTDLKHDNPGLNVVVVCLLRTGGVRGSAPFAQLRQLAADPLKQDSASAIRATIVVDDRSPLYRAHGEPVADQVVARSLSGMLLAPIHSPANPAFVTVLGNLNDAGYTFAALSTDSTAMVTGDTNGARRSNSMGSVSSEQAVDRIADTSRRLLTGATATTVEKTPKSGQAALYLNFIVPISARTADFSKFRTLISNCLVATYSQYDTYTNYLYGVVEGEGVDLSETSHTSKGDRYAQVGILYGITDADLPQHAVGAPANVVDAGESN